MKIKNTHTEKISVHLVLGNQNSTKIDMRACVCMRTKSVEHKRFPAEKTVTTNKKLKKTVSNVFICKYFFQK